MRAVADPAERIHDLPLLSETERRTLLHDFNAEPATYPRDACVHLMFEAQVERTPDAVAVEFGDRCLTYRQLNARANRLARHLKRLGSRPDLLVGMCVERSLDMVVSMLGILKSGAAYVPLDPSYPKERLSFMLDGVRALVAERSLPHPLSQIEIPVVCLADVEAALAVESAENPRPAASADDLAYVIYTSGSTGRPKGVAMSHGPIACMVWWQMQSSRATAGTRTAQFASLSFDVSFQEIISTLCSGGVLVLVSEETRRDAESLGRLLEGAQIERLFAPMVMLQQLAERAEASNSMPRGLREIMTAGEQLRITPQIERFFTRLANCTLYNHYGPSETHAATAFALDGDARDWPRLPPIGRALPHARVYILDERLEPAPAGVIGELTVGGSGLARGYLDSAGLTAEKFVADPHALQPGGRLYRTGDLARYRADGLIEFMGRSDHQVKIRGFRVELGEIESVLERHTAVGQAVAIAREDKPGVKQLVAFIVPQAGAKPSGSELREYLRERLPGYMLPSAFQMVAELPLTRSGKVDRAALPMLAIERLEPENDYVPPRNPIEEILVAIWSEALGVERVGIHDNFFDLGGHSIMATRLISRLRDAFDNDLPLRNLFEHPTVAELAEAVAAEALGGRVRQSPPGASAPVERRNTPSFAQERMWFLHQLDPGSAAYNIPAAVRLRGRLNLPALQSSFNEILRRHESLRTSFTLKDGQGVRCVGDYKAFQLLVEDFATADENDREDELQEVTRAEARRPFDLASPPLWRLRLLRLQPQEHVLLLTLHHIIADGWSIEVFVREFAELYASYASRAAGQQGQMEGLPIQYGDYAAWQRERMENGKLDAQVEYWRGQLGGALPVLSLPTDRPRPAVQSHQGGSVAINISRDLRDGLREVCRHECATLFMCLLGAFDVLLHRYSGQEVILVGVPVANRNYREVEGLIGLFTNTLVMRAALQPGATFRELLRQVRAVALGAYAHQDIPFEKVVESVRPDRALSHAPLFQVAFAIQNMPLPALELAGLKLELMNVDNQTAKFDLTCVVEDSEDGLAVTAQYNADLFDEATAKRMLNHYAALLQSCAANADQAIGDLPLLTPDERRQMLRDWNSTAADYPHATVHQLIEEQARSIPDAVALHAGAEQVTYAELNRRANQLAHYLMRQGVGPETRVGVCMERGVEMVVGLLAALKAGAAYVPLDPTYPIDRLEYMAHDAGVKLMVTQERFLAVIGACGAAPVCVDRESRQIAAETEGDPSVSASPDNLVYVLYTSGSTGRPKGVAISHLSLCNHMKWVCTQFSITERDSMLQKTPFTFDASVWEFYAPLLTGGRMVIARPEGHRDTAYLINRIRECQVTLLQVAPTLLLALVEEKGLGECRSLRAVFCGGEELSAQLQRRFQERLDARLVNLYGPTEVTIDATCWEARAGEEGVWIGRPVSNTQAYVLGRGMELMPLGVGGELYLGGVQLARGYLERSGLTAERFVPDPFSGKPGARVYRTGDRARWQSDGNLEYLGRSDHQVKIRGFRIELEEVESVLAGHPAVRECLVIASEEGQGGKRLVAYVAPRGGATVSEKELRGYLRERLPDYMAPSAFVALERMPLTASGKIDRRSLPAPQRAQLEADDRHAAPRDPEEEVVAAIWSHALALERVGMQDNFFDLGGHSLLAMQVALRLRAAFQVEVPVRKLFEHPTVEELAGWIKSQRMAGLSIEAPLTRRTSGARAPLSYAQERLWFLDQLETEKSIYNTVAALRLKGELDVAALEESLNEIIRRHEALRTIFHGDAGAPVQVIRPFEPIALQVMDLSATDETRRDACMQEVLAEQARRPFDLASGPLLRAILLREAEDAHVLAVVMHHIITDGWSMGVLTRELAALYEAFLQDQPSPLDEPDIQYADYAIWQRQWLEGEILQKQLDYWRGRLQGVRPTLELPADRARPPAQSFRGMMIHTSLPAALAQRLRRMCSQEGVTVYMALLAAAQTLLARYSNQTDISVGSPFANRNRPEIEGLIGFFANTLVMRTDLSGAPGFRELLSRVRETVLDAFAHQDLPFELLVEQLNPVRDLSHSPLFQVLFVLQNAPGGELTLPGLSLTPFEAQTGLTHFDLTLSIAEEDGVEEDGRLIASWEYSTDLFDESTIRRMAGHFETLLMRAVADPAERIHDLPLLSETERRQMLRDWNSMAADYPRATIHQLIEEQVRRTPAAVALQAGAEQVTYAELNRRANQLARLLIGKGIGPEDVAALAMPRSPEMVIALLGILKAGAAYLPIDPDYPPERIAFVFEDAEPACVLTTNVLRTRLPGTVEALCFGGPEMEAALDLVPSHNLIDEERNSPLRPHQAAYVIYTSGSTGKPKGVVVTHANLAHSTSARVSYYREPVDRFLLLSSVAFDSSVAGIFWTLTTGGALVLPPEGSAADAEMQAALIASHGITHLLALPALYSLILENARPNQLSALGMAIVAGEACAEEVVNRHCAAAPQSLLFNEYGPSEATVWSSVYEVPCAIKLAGSISIGRPIANTQVYILDKRQEPAPVGVVGELYIAGAGLARGYLKRPGLTSERFVADPFGEPGRRMYRSGDLARWRADGNLEYLGRSDHQVKIRASALSLKR
ncbi:MAG TPA: amino acid adenylation domain-containing protein [Blastocatellia bacterium]|nr:amino acid adenylation domain-containing protein [Blastocatellia bacterium]